MRNAGAYACAVGSDGKGVSGWEVGGGVMRGGEWVFGWRGGWVGGHPGHECKLCNAFEVVPVGFLQCVKLRMPTY